MRFARECLSTPMLAVVVRMNDFDSWERILFLSVVTWRHRPFSTANPPNLAALESVPGDNESRHINRNNVMGILNQNQSGEASSSLLLPSLIFIKLVPCRISTTTIMTSSSTKDSPFQSIKRASLRSHFLLFDSKAQNVCCFFPLWFSRRSKV